MKIGKYCFDSKEQAELKINKFKDSEHCFARLGAITEGKYNIDVLWMDDLEDHPKGWKSYSIDVEGEGVHKFAGQSYQSNKIIQNADS